MNSKHLRVCGLVLLTSTATAASAAAKPAETALVGGTVVDVDKGAEIKDSVVIISGDRILAVGPRAQVHIPRAAKVVDVTGKWLSPGLIDAHVHFFQSGGLYTRPDALDLTKIVPYAQDVNRSKERLPETFRRYLASGVTSVVDAGGPLLNYEVRRLSESARPAPRVAVAGPLIATEPTPQQQKLDLGDPPIISAASPEEARKLAIAQLAHNPDFIKIWGIGSGKEGAARVRDMTRAVADVAHKANTRVAVHATDLEIAQAALDGGADILVHSVDDAPVTPEFIRAVKARNVVYVTTAVVHEGYVDAFIGRPDLLSIERTLGAPDIIASLYEVPPQIAASASRALPADSLGQIFRNAKTLTEAGARVAAGTDAGNIGTLHGPAIHRELQLLSRAGMTPAQVLRAATRDAAYAYSPKPDIGLIAAGYRADLLVLNADPLADVANLQRIASVWSRGFELNPGQLLPATPESVVQQQLDRYNAHDIDGFLATYSDDVEVFDLPGANKPRLQGKEAARQRYSALFARLPKLNCRSAQRVVQGEFVIDHEICSTGMDRRPLQAAAIYQVTNEKIRRVWFAQARGPSK